MKRFLRTVAVVCVVAAIALTPSAAAVDMEGIDFPSFDLDGLEDEVTTSEQPVSEAVTQMPTEEASPYIRVEIDETFHQEYGLYEELMCSRFVFYSNVANGAITDKPVTVELPANVRCEAEKNGVAFDFVSGEEYAETGSYVLNILADGSELYGGSDDDIYCGLFRFKIAEKPPEATSTTEEAETTDSTESPFIIDLDFGLSTTNAPVYTAELIPELTEAPEATTTTYESSALETTTTLDESSAAETTTTLDESGAADTTTTPAETAEATAPGAEETATTELTEATSGQSDEADAEDATEGNEEEESEEPVMPEGDCFLITMTREEGDKLFVGKTTGGVTFSSSVPNNFITPSSVRVSFDESVAYAVYLDGVEIEKSSSYYDAGQYSIYIYDGTSEPYPLFRFRIINTLCNNLSEYAVPLDCSITFAALEGKQLPITSPKSLPLNEDGEYTVIIATAGGSETVIFTLDTVPPKIEMTDEGGLYEVVFDETDVETVQVTRDGENYNAKSYAFTDNGEFVVTVFDAAGNSASVEFEIPYTMNVMGIIVILLVIAGVVLCIVFMVHSKKHFKIR